MKRIFKLSSNKKIGQMAIDDQKNYISKICNVLYDNQIKTSSCVLIYMFDTFIAMYVWNQN